MGTGRTLNKDPRTRPIKSQGEKRRRYKAQRARLVKLGMDEVAVAKLQPDVLRTLVQKPVMVKKIVAAKAAQPADAAAKPAKAKKVVKEPKAAKAVKEPKAPKAAAKVTKAPKAAKKAE